MKLNHDFAQVENMILFTIGFTCSFYHFTDG